MNTVSYTLDDVVGFAPSFRKTFINSLNGFKMPVLIGSVDFQGQTNLAIFNSLIHIGAMPPLIGLIFRPDSVERHTLQNILETKVFTVNHIKKEFYQKAHQTAARYSKQQSEFKEVGLMPEYFSGCPAPFVKESDIKIQADFMERLEITANNTTLLIARIHSIHLPSPVLMKDGHVDLEKAGSLVSCGLDSYYETLSLSRLSYAKPNRELSELKSEQLL